MPFVARYNQHFTGTVHVRLKEPFVQNLRQLNKDAADAFGNQTIDFVSYEKADYPIPTTVSACSAMPHLWRP